MGNEEKKVDKKPNVFVENLAILATPEGIQNYILGTKKNGKPRAVYDVVKDFTKISKKKKKKNKKGKKHNDDMYAFYINTKKNKKKKKKKKDKYWHI